MKKFIDSKVTKNVKVTSDVWDLVIHRPEITDIAKAGQFVNIYLNDKDKLLPRPISICEILKDSGEIRMLFRVVGAGTEIMSKLCVGDILKVLAPLGNSFEVDVYDDNICVIGGGIGVPPMFQLTNEIIRKNPKAKISVFLGFRSESILVDEFKALGVDTFVATDDGSEGFHGNVLQLILSRDKKFEKIYACGPNVMLKGIAEYASERNITFFASMEERMACGIGVCVCCAVKVVDPSDENDYIYKKACVDGPIFNSAEVIWR